MVCQERLSWLAAEDLTIRKTLKERLFHAGVPKIEIERAGQNMRVIIYTARPGIIIGKKGAEVEKLRKDLKDMTKKEVSIDIKKSENLKWTHSLLRNVASSSKAVLQASDEKIYSFRYAIWYPGVKIACSGRLAGAEIAARMVQGGKSPAPYIQGWYQLWIRKSKDHIRHHRVKVWMYQGDILPKADPRNIGDTMLMPKKVKFRKMQKGRMNGRLIAVLRYRLRVRLKALEPDGFQASRLRQQELRLPVMPRGLQGMDQNFSG